MELGLIASTGAVGHFIGSSQEPNNKPPFKKISRTRKSSGPDVYNQNRLVDSDTKHLTYSKSKHQNSLSPKETNVVPNYYNKLGHLMDKTRVSKFQNNFTTSVNAPDDQIYYDPRKEIMRKATTDDFGVNYTGSNQRNNIFNSPIFDRKNLFLRDEYEIFDCENPKKTIDIPGVDRKLKVNDPENILSHKISREQSNVDVIEGFSGRPTKNFRDYLGKDKIADNHLLDVSESLTDNANSIRRILSEDVVNNSPVCKRTPTPKDDQRSKRLIGVTPDYKSVLVDDAVARYPSFKYEREKTLPTANYPSYLSQFDPQSFDNEGLPSAPNDVYYGKNKNVINNLKQCISFDGGWSPYGENEKMSYGVVSDDQLTHDNMMPFFKEKSGYGSNDFYQENVMNRKNELFTGNLKTEWNKKQEVRPHFAPVADLSYIYGTPVRAETEESRYIPSRYLGQGAKLFDPVRVTPGVNLDYDEIGTHGYQSVYRALPKTIDDLRVDSRKQVTYPGRVIEGMRGQERPVQAPVVSYRPDGFKITSEADLLPKTDVTQGPKTRDNFIMKETNRPDQHIEYTGSAFGVTEAVGRNVPEEMREKVKYSTRQNFTLPVPLQKYARDETMYNPNTESYDLQPTAREQTGHTNHYGPTTSTTGNQTYANHQDIARTTIRQTTNIDPSQSSNIKSNTLYGTVQPMDIAKTTIKETTVDQPLNPNAPGLNNVQRVYNSDVARTTIRETQEGPIEPSNMKPINNSTYSNWTDDARITLKQTTVEIPRNTQVLAIDQFQGAVPLQDVAKSTTKETTVDVPWENFTTPVGQAQGQRNLQDNAKTTRKEITVQIPYETFLTAVGQSQGQRHLQDDAKTTRKEVTVQIPYETFLTAVGQSQGQRNLQDNARTTRKEITVQVPYETFVTAVNQAQGQRHLQDGAKTTRKEITVQVPYETFVTAVGQSQGQRHLQDNAKTTRREITTQIPYETFVTAVDQAHGQRHLQDIARTTRKEGTVQTPYETFVTAVDQAQGQRHLQDTARTTKKEGTVQIPYETFVTAVDQAQGKRQLQDNARTTRKEGTVQIPYETFITAVNQAQGQRHLQDNAKTTRKENTVQIPYETFVTAVGQTQGQRHLQDIAKTTRREGTVQVPWETFVTAVGQLQGKTNLQDTAKTTRKESTVQIPYETFVTAIGQAQGQVPLQDIAKTTRKEGTVQIPYETYVTAVGQSQGKTHLQDNAKTTRREMTVEIPYETYVTAVGQSQGKTHLQDNAKTTRKEMTVEIPYETYVTAVGQSQGQVPLQDNAKTTRKEMTVEIPYETYVTAVGQSQGKTNLQDNAKTTRKEMTVEIPYETYVTAVGRSQGKASGFNRDPLRNTIKETTIDNDYIGPALGDLHSRRYDAEYNAQIDDRRESMQVYRPPTSSNVDLGPIKEQLNVYLKNDDNNVPNLMPVYSVNNNLDRPLPIGTARQSAHIPNSLMVDPQILRQLNNNPFNIPYYGHYTNS